MKLSLYIGLLVAWLFCSAAAFASEDLFSDYRQLLPRGGIPAITHPHYVTANEANIAPGSYVLGVVINGEARAYSLNLLNHHEIVNDSIDGTAFAAVW